MKLRLTAIIPVLCAGLAAGSALAVEKAAGPVTLKSHIQPLLKEFCVDCHNDEKHKGDFNMTPFLDNPQLAEHRKAWEKVLEFVESREMPPDKKPQPTQEQRDLLMHFIEG